MLDVTVDKAGKVQHVRVVRGVEPKTKDFVAGVRKVRYIPYVLDGAATAIVYTHTFELRADD